MKKNKLLKLQLWQKKNLLWHKKWYQKWIDAQKSGDLKTLQTIPPPPIPPPPDDGE